MKVFFDTEFTHFNRPRLISAGFAAERGGTYYFELAEGQRTWRREECSDFVKETVLPLLGPENKRLSLEEAAHRLEGFLVLLREPIELVCDSDFDHRLLHSLWQRTQITRPAQISGFGMHIPMPEGLRAAEEIFRDLPQHHAGNDARALRAGWLTEQKLVASTKPKP
jgi:hypothetical protein